MALFAAAAIGLVGTLAAAAFIVLALALVAMRPLATGRELLHYSPLLILALLAMASAIWSDAPQTTMRAGIQLLLTMMAAIVVYLRAGSRSVVLILFIAFLAITLVALPFVPGALTSGHPLQAMYGSKNQLGFSAHMAIALALAVGCDREQPRAARLATLAALPLCAGILLMTQSATALTSAGVTLFVFPLLLLFGRVPVSGRVALFVVGAALLGVALFFMQDIANAIADFRQNVLNKNATLTGRTYLWEAAARLSAERPLLGYGYSAFWQQGNLEAEGLWRWGGIANRSGFNFHNAFVEMKIDLGLIGQYILLTTCAVFAAAGLFRQLVSPSVPMAFFLALQVVMYLRSYAESGLIAPFSLITMMWVMAGMCALSKFPREKIMPQTAPARRRPQLPRDPVRA